MPTLKKNISKQLFSREIIAYQLKLHLLCLFHNLYLVLFYFFE